MIRLVAADPAMRLTEPRLALGRLGASSLVAAPTSPVHGAERGVPLRLRRAPRCLAPPAAPPVLWVRHQAVYRRRGPALLFKTELGDHAVRLAEERAALHGFHAPQLLTVPRHGGDRLDSLRLPRQPRKRRMGLQQRQARQRHAYRELRVYIPEAVRRHTGASLLREMPGPVVRVT